MAELDKQLEGVSKGIGTLVKNLADVNKGVAENAAGVANANKDTFTGFLTRGKLRRALEKADTAELKKKTEQVARAEKANAKAEKAVADKQALIEKEIDESKKVADVKAKIAILNAAKEGASTEKQLEIQEQINNESNVIAAEALRIQGKHADDLGGLVSTQEQKTSALEKRMEERNVLEKDFNSKIAEAAQNESFTEFNDSLKGLTGIDIGGGLDKVVETWNQIGGVAKGFWKAAIRIPIIGPWIERAGMAIQAAGTAFLASMKAAAAAMWSHVKKFALLIPAFIAASIAFVASMWTSLTAMASAAMAMLAPALPFILIGLAIVALAAMLIWGGMMLYEKSETFREIVDVVMGYFSSIIEAIGRIFSGFYDFFVGLFTGDFDMMFGGIKDVFGGLWDLIKAPFVAIGDFFKSVFDIDIWGILRNLASKILPDWLVNRIFGAEAEPEPEVKQSKAIDKDVSEDEQDIIDQQEQDRKDLEAFEKESLAEFNSGNFGDDFDHDGAGGEVYGGEEVDDDFFGDGDDGTMDLTPPQKLAEQVEEPVKDKIMAENRKVEMQLRRAAHQAILDHQKKESERIGDLLSSGDISARTAQMMQGALWEATQDDLKGLEDGTSQTLDDMREAEALATGQDKWQVGDELATKRELQEEAYVERGRMTEEQGIGAAIEDSRKDRLRFDDPQGGAELAGATAEAGQAGGGTQQAIVTNVNQTTSNAAQTVQHTSVPTPRDNDPTGARLAAVPA